MTPSLPAGDDINALFEIEPWIQEWIEELRADPKDRHFYKVPLVQAAMMMVTFRAFSEKLVEPGATLRETMEALMGLWRRGYVKFVHDPKTGANRIEPSMPGEEPGPEGTLTRRRRRAAAAESRKRKH